MKHKEINLYSQHNIIEMDQIDELTEFLVELHITYKDQPNTGQQAGEHHC